MIRRWVATPISVHHDLRPALPARRLGIPQRDVPTSARCTTSGTAVFGPYKNIRGIRGCTLLNTVTKKVRRGEAVIGRRQDPPGNAGAHRVELERRADDV